MYMQDYIDVCLSELGHRYFGCLSPFLCGGMSCAIVLQMDQCDLRDMNVCSSSLVIDKW